MSTPKSNIPYAAINISKEEMRQLRKRKDPFAKYALKKWKQFSFYKSKPK